MISEVELGQTPYIEFWNITGPTGRPKLITVVRPEWFQTPSPLFIPRIITLETRVKVHRKLLTSIWERQCDTHHWRVWWRNKYKVFSIEHGAWAFQKIL